MAYAVAVSGPASSASLKLTLTDGEGRCVASSTGPSGVLKVTDARLWWPYLMHQRPGFLYSLEVRGRGLPLRQTQGRRGAVRRENTSSQGRC